MAYHGVIRGLPVYEVIIVQSNVNTANGGANDIPLKPPNTWLIIMLFGLILFHTCQCIISSTMTDSDLPGYPGNGTESLPDIAGEPVPNEATKRDPYIVSTTTEVTCKEWNVQPKYLKREIRQPLVSAGSFDTLPSCRLLKRAQFGRTAGQIMDDGVTKKLRNICNTLAIAPCDAHHGTHSCQSQSGHLCHDREHDRKSKTKIDLVLCGSQY